MGYPIIVLNADWRIAADQVEKAYASLRLLIGHETVNRRKFPNLQGKTHFSFVDSDDFATSPDLVSALKAWRWITYKEPNGDLLDLELDGGERKLGDEALLFSVLAPYVDDGGYIDILGRDDGRVWRWLFQKGELLHCDGKVTFDAGVPAVSYRR